MQLNAQNESDHPVITPKDPVTHPEVPDTPNPTEPEGAPNPAPVTDPLADPYTEPASEPEPPPPFPEPLPGDTPPQVDF